MKRLAAIAIACLALSAKAPGAPVIHIEDVARFYRIYDAAHGHPSAAVVQRDYLDSGSDGLHTFATLRHITGAAIAKTLALHPEVYAGAKRCMAVLPAARLRIDAALRKLGDLYPEARFPPVTIAVGRGKPVGVGSPKDGVMIGLEALCAVHYFNANPEDRFVHVIAHEYVHVQQVQSLVDDEHPTVLEASLIEGAADFVGEMISGGLSYSYFDAMTKGREKEIETAFAADEDKRDLSRWLYNGTLEKPGDVGYWVGYRIVKSYWQHAADKRQALRDIIGMRDPEAFLARSGWYPGIRLK
ncbi:MAG: lytic murein transglycosylase [Alphaproteobacteria bacterium]|nr:lytic murein transglycosylase [Alphaproteobacteria bacterium]